MKSNFAVRTMRAGELELALEWARQEGWNPGVDDALAFWEADPSGFFIGAIGEVPVGCISVVRYGESFAFLGLYIVHPEFRGKGYGKALWKKGMAFAGNRTIGLDGVVAQQENYRSSGFEMAYRTVRYGGVPRMPDIGEAKVDVVPVTQDKLEGLLRYDAAIFPGLRYSFLTAWCGAPEKRKSVMVGSGSKIRGYGTIRRCFEGYKVGPLFANSSDVASALLAKLLPEAKGRPVYMDVPTDNIDAIRLAEAAGLSPVFETARMYRGEPPKMPLDRVFAVTTLELG
ncbi:GNAT family N-acetyltransferase [Rhizobium sp. CB3171]|uniref:GNAT family N-acetyltransferase n=1 Tax=unclassified Rhizobium TaxID=2613769 RepID=UPI0021A96810|nr:MULTISPECIES: GNAT family N-acetyltransferase [Rhizobium]MDK4738363.1 GNAT family N-acetyltransferase [Rhizobium sp. CNPSo 3464]UWU20006.1 GNAT family N-acetyltransferase [Rhizobium tropici]WFU00830.1 GNAT family N-acetyltransferase [Rhizobium sp. CB3171]